MTASDQRGMAGMRILSGEKINPAITISAKHFAPSIAQSAELGSAAQVMLAGKVKKHVSGNVLTQQIGVDLTPGYLTGKPEMLFDPSKD